MPAARDRSVPDQPARPHLPRSWFRRIENSFLIPTTQANWSKTPPRTEKCQTDVADHRHHSNGLGRTILKPIMPPGIRIYALSLIQSATRLRRPPTPEHKWHSRAIEYQVSGFRLGCGPTYSVSALFIRLIRVALISSSFWAGSEAEIFA